MIIVKNSNFEPLLYLTQFIVIMLKCSVNEGKFNHVNVYNSDADSNNYSSCIRARAVWITVYVCHGGTLNITCTTTAELDTLQWTAFSPQYPTTFIRGLSKRGTAQPAQPLLTNLTTLYISRSLNETLSLPLMSTIFTDNATADLNGTIVTCLAVTAGQPLANASLQTIS